MPSFSISGDAFSTPEDTQASTSDPREIGDKVPAEYAAHLGVYHLAALQADFEVLFHKGGLAVKDPIEKQTVRIRPAGDGKRWVDEFDKNSISFEREEGGKITAMTIDAISKCRRK